MGNFCKNQDCPSSEMILAFACGDANQFEYGVVRHHLSMCEFCLAEAEFYRAYPPFDERVPAERIPEPLFELAEALLHKDRDLSPLYQLIDSY